MAITNTTITDLVPSEKALEVAVNLLLEQKNELVTSGLAVRGVEVDAVASGGPRKASLQYLNPLDTSAVNVSTDNISDLGDVGKLTAGEFDVLRHDLNYGWGASDLANMVTRYSAEGGIRAGIAQYWRGVFQTIAHNSVMCVYNSINALATTGDVDGDGDTDATDTTLGAANAAIKSTLILGSSGTAFSTDLWIDAAATGGMHADQFNMVIVSPKNYATMQKAEGNDFIPASKTDIGFAMYKGFYVLRSQAFGDQMDVVCRAGALAFGTGTPSGMVPFEIERVANGGKGSGATILHSRQSVVCHPQGTSYAGAVAPAPSDLTSASRWKLEVPADQFGFRFVKHA